jgi:hypothetical protein
MPKKKKTEEDELIDFIGEVICSESALLASSINLLRAGDIAKEKGDAELLLKVADAWYDLARFLSGEEEEEEKKPSQFGFSALEVLDEPGDEPDQSEGRVKIRKKHR